MRSRVWLSATMAVAATAALSGCASETVAERHLADMREQVSRMQADHDKFDQRLGALEVAVAEEKSPGDAAPTANAGVGPATPVRAVQLGGPSEAEPADPNDTSPRPDIRMTGQAGAASVARPSPRAGKSNARGRVEDTEPMRSSALDPDAKKAYEAALAQVQAKQYDRGLEGLNAFLVRWPDHPFAENAMYWRGEAYFAQGEYLRAAEQFEAVIARFGGGNKGPDALLKLGMCHDRLGASQRAREYWNRLKADFPRSDAAKRIPAAARDARDDSSPKGPKENR